MNTNCQTITESVYMRKRSQVLSIFLLAGIDVSEAEDMTQDVFVRLLGVDVLNRDTADAMVIKIAFNLKTDYFRKRRLPRVSLSDIFDVEDKYNTPLMDMYVKDIARHEDDAVMALPPMQAKAYVMSMREDMSMSDISAVLGVSPRTIETHLYLSRRKVRSYLRKVL